MLFFRNYIAFQWKIIFSLFTGFDSPSKSRHRSSFSSILFSPTLGPKDGIMNDPLQKELFWFSWMQIPLYFFGTPHSFLALVYHHQWWQFILSQEETGLEINISPRLSKKTRKNISFFWRDTKMAEEYHQHPLWFTWLYYIADGTASATIMAQNRDSWRCHYWAFMLILFTIKVNAKKTKKMLWKR